MAGKKGRSGPARGNVNGLRTGATMSKRLTVGELPAKMIAVKREARAYRRDIESEVIAVRGAISLTDAHHIDTAAAATIAAGICRWLLRHRVETMTTAEIMACTQRITQAKQARDAAIRALGLDRDGHQDVIATLYKVLPAPTADVETEEHDR